MTTRKWELGLVGLVVLVTGRLCVGDTITTAEVQVVDSPAGEFVPLEIGTPFSGWSDRTEWYSFPQAIEQQPLHFWQVMGGGSGPAASYGIISFEVLTDGPVLLAVTNRWGSGGNESGDVDWILQLTTRDQFLTLGWTEYASPMLLWNNALQSVGGTEFAVFRRDCVQGDAFTLRTEKYVPPTLLTTQFADPIPEPSTLAALTSMGRMGLAIAWRRRKRAA